MFGKKTAPKPDAALLARVSDSSEVDLGTYPEDALAVTGAYPARGALDPRPDGPSAFRRLDSEARKAAMQAALDRLVADGTLNMPPGASLKDVVADGLDGKLAVMGPMADLYRLACWFHRRGFQSGMVMFMETTDGFDPERDFARYEAINPRNREWQELMASMQEPIPGAQPGEWWAEMKLVFTL